jgi:hypothetical protein
VERCFCTEGGQAACFIPWKRTKSSLLGGFKVCKTGIGSFFLFRDRLIVFGIKSGGAPIQSATGEVSSYNSHPTSKHIQTVEEILVGKTNPLVAATIK